MSGANFLAADLRDTDIRGTDLSRSIFLTQVQVNAAKGDKKTKLPKIISKPSAWLEESTC